MDINKESDNRDYKKQEIEVLKKQILQSAVLAFCALCALVFVSVAWFMNNSRVSGSNLNVTAEGAYFELASAGKPSDVRGTLPEEYRVAEGDTLTEQTTWTNGKQTIEWNMSETANFGNINSDVVGSNEGISPGRSGTLKFIVIPKQNGSLNLNITLSIIFLRESNSGWEEVNDPEAIDSLLRGHLLFAFTPYGQDNNVLVSHNGQFSLELNNVTEDKQIPISIDWFWPETLEKAKNHEKFGDEIVDLMMGHPEWFFYNKGENIDISIDTTSEDEKKTINDYFNNADKFIGDNVDAIVLRLTAEKTN